MDRRPLTDEELAAALPGLPGWALVEGALERRWRFADFRAAFAFFTRVAFEAEALDHHPEILNVWAHVRLRLNTHDAGGRVTALDVELARRISALPA